MQVPTTEQARETLRAVSWPGFEQHIVAAGFVKEIDIRDGAVRVGFGVRRRRTDKVDAMGKRTRQVVSSLPGVERVEIRRIEPEVTLIPEARRNPGSAGRGSERGMAASALR